MERLYLQSILAAVFMIVVSNANVSAEPPIDSPEQKVLDKWLGRWQTTYKLPKAEWTPEERTGTAELVTTRVVGRRFVQEKSEHSDKTSGTTLVTYDTQKKSYRGWWFSSEGYTSESSGEWDAVTKTMTWTSTQEGNTTTTKYRFIDDNNIEWAVLVRSGNNKILYRMEGKSVRVIEPTQ